MSVTESAPKLRTKLEACKTMGFVNTATDTTKAKGVLQVVGDVVGLFMEDVGVADAARSADYPNGDEGVLIYAAEKILVGKTTNTGYSISTGEAVYLDTTTNLVSTTTTDTKCGVALEYVGTTDTEVLIELDGKMGA